MDNSDYLAHYGVLGMRWGVRHNRGYRSTLKQLKADRKAKRQKINDDWLKSDGASKLKGKSAKERKRIMRENAQKLQNVK